MQAVICYISGSLLVAIAAIDVFLTILYARSGFSLLSNYINRWGWLLFRLVARTFYGRKDLIFSFCGPFLMIFTLFFWAILMIAGFALVTWPQLGALVTASSGMTDQGFWNAFFYSGYNFTTLGLGDLLPRNDLFRFLAVLEAGMGFAFFTISISYFISVYDAIQRRNSLALRLNHRTSGTADAGNYIAGQWRDGDIHDMRRELSELSVTISNIMESHHLYPILHYFRFQENHRSAPLLLAICLEIASLTKSAGEGPRQHFKPMAAADQAWNSVMDLLAMMTTFMPKQFRDHIGREDHIDTALFHRRFFNIIEKIDHDLPEEHTELAAAAEKICPIADAMAYPCDRSRPLTVIYGR
jgi:hypothetical protein